MLGRVSLQLGLERSENWVELGWGDAVKGRQPEAQEEADNMGRGVSSTVTGHDQAEAERAPAWGCHRHKAESQCMSNAYCIQQALAIWD